MDGEGNVGEAVEGQVGMAPAYAQGVSASRVRGRYK